MSQSVITMYATKFCPYCVRARHLLNQKGASFREIRVDKHPDQRVEMQRLSGRRTVPQIWIGETHVGGCDELVALDRRGQLDSLIEKSSLD